MKRASEIVSYFKCKNCCNFWRIADAPDEKKNWFCPWCGIAQAEDNEDCANPQELQKTLDDASKELEKLFSELGNLFKKK